MLTDHGERRLRGRLRIEEDLIDYVNRVLTHGVYYNNTTGVLRRFLEDAHHAGTTNKDLVVYDGKLHVFSPQGSLMTAWKLPSLGEMKNEQDICDQRFARSQRPSSKGPKRNRRKSSPRGNPHNYHDW